MRCMADVPAPATYRHVPGPVRTYAAELIGLARRLDPGEGWYAVFTEHDPHGLQECLSGREMPPWDVVASLLQDLARLHGPGEAHRAERRLRTLHGAAARAFDANAGGEPLLRDRLTVAARELDHAESRLHALERRAADGAAAGTGTDLIWARDYLIRVEARCAELRERLLVLESAGVEYEDHGRGRSREDLSGTDKPPEISQAVAAPRTRRLRTGGSRFAGALENGADAGAEPAPIVPPGAPSPDLAGRADAAPTCGEGAPRGARFAGAVQPGAARRSVPGEHELAEMRAAAEETVTDLTRLRRAGRGGEAHVLLCAAAGRPAAHLAILVRELKASGMDSDAGMLLWEAAGLPPAGLAAAADALSAMGQSTDSARLLRQGVSRPLPQIAEAAVLLHRAGRRAEVTELLAALIRSRTPGEAAGVAHAEPAVLVGALLDAAGALSADHYRGVANALRGAGLPGVPEGR